MNISFLMSPKFSLILQNPAGIFVNIMRSNVRKFGDHQFHDFTKSFGVVQNKKIISVKRYKILVTLGIFCITNSLLVSRY